MTFDSIDVVDYKYFGLGNIAKVNYPQSGVDMTLANSSTYSGLDRFGRVIDLPWTKSTAGDLVHLKYGYDQSSNRIYRENVKATAESAKFDELYRYDGLQQLNSFNRGQLKLPERDRITTLEYKQDWQLDQTGNWSQFKQYDQSSQSNALDQQRTQNTANEITAFNSTVGDVWKTPSHDRNGNMTTMPKPIDLTAGYDAKYDAWNRLTEVKETGGATVADYQYDGLNRRTTKLVSGTTTHFYYSDDWQVLEERLNALTTANQQYVWGIRYIDDLVLRDHTTLGLHYALQDANWNVVAIADTTGGIVQRFEYDAYGKSLVLKPDFTIPYTGTDYQWEYRFTGRRLDLETDLYQYRHRYYHAELGRFINRDPIGYNDGFNLYEYVGGQPIILIDPLGLQAANQAVNNPVRFIEYKTAPVFGPAFDVKIRIVLQAAKKNRPKFMTQVNNSTLKIYDKNKLILQHTRKVIDVVPIANITSFIDTRKSNSKDKKQLAFAKQNLAPNKCIRWEYTESNTILFYNKASFRNIKTPNAAWVLYDPLKHKSVTGKASGMFSFSTTTSLHLQGQELKDGTSDGLDVKWGNKSQVGKPIKWTSEVKGNLKDKTMTAKVRWSNVTGKKINLDYDGPYPMNAKKLQKSNSK